MPKRASSSKKRKTATDTSFLAQLQMLRNFVGSDFDEGDLSACLRKCGCNIQMAAEKLMTGEYQSKKEKGSSNFFAAKTPKVSEAKSNATTPATKRPRVTPAMASTARRTTASIPKSSSLSTSVASIPNNNNNNNATQTPKPAPVKNDGRHLWLCERWIVGLSTTKNGHFKYQERLDLSHSHSGPAMVRFRGRGIEGTLRPNVSALLTPLLRHDTPLVSLEAHALMEERGVAIGGDVPLCLR